MQAQPTGLSMLLHETVAVTDHLGKQRVILAANHWPQLPLFASLPSSAPLRAARPAMAAVAADDDFPQKQRQLGLPPWSARYNRVWRPCVVGIDQMLQQMLERISLCVRAPLWPQHAHVAVVV